VSDPRALSFGPEAERYELARPSYPEALLDELVRDGAEAVLDIGCGTGKAGRLFAARGCRVLGVEPDERMATIARQHLDAIEVSRFEDWDAGERHFDLVVCAQAWHWLDERAALPTIAGVLPAGRRLAAFWNFPEHDADVRVALDAVYAREAPSLADSIHALGRVDRLDSVGAAAKGIAASGAFEPPERLTFDWTLDVTARQWVDQLRTFSDHALLPPETREPLLHGIEEAIDNLGGAMVLRYTTYLVVAARC
jgi:SAM-dependent methyltransferase